MKTPKNDTAKEPQRISDVAVGAVRIIHKLIETHGAISGLSSGFRDLDSVLWGFQPGHLIVVAGRPSMGKTALTLNFTESVALPKNGGTPEPVLFASMESYAESIAHQMLLSRARVRSDRLRGGFTSRAEELQLAQTAVELKSAPLSIHSDGSISVEDLRKAAQSQPCSLLVVDSIQLIKPTYPTADRWEQLSLVARELKALAMDLRMPVVVTAQLNRDSERERREPRLSDLSESGLLEQVADVVLLLSRPSDDGTSIAAEHVDLIVAKNRQGPIARIRLAFTREYTRFDEVTYDEKAG